MLRLMITSRAAKSCYQTQKLALKSSTPLVLSQLQPNVTRQSTRRNFQSSITRCASVSNDDELPQKLQNSPDLMEKVHKFMQLLETKGVDIRSGKPPGLTQMAKLVMDGEVRDATTEVANALKEAGINFSPTQISSLMQGWKDNNKGGSEEK